MTNEIEDPILDAMWKGTLQAWDDEKRHAALLDYALRNEKLPILAGNYRALKDDTDKGPLAKKRLDAIVLAATQMLMSMKTPKPTRSPLWLTATAGLVMLLIVGSVIYALFKH
jgi:hypothetical protein